MPERAEGWYVYCVLPAEAQPALDELTGVDGTAPIEAVLAGGLRALVSRVPLDEFGEAPLRRNLEQLPWVERTARAHDAVLTRTLACDAVLPLRMFTIFADEDQVRALLVRERERFASALRRLRGHAEWSVKAMVDERRPAEAPAAAGAVVATDAPDAGRAFFARRRAEAAGRERSAEQAASIATEVHGRLREIASAAALLPPQRPELSGRRGTMVLNGAYLVARTEEPAFSAAVTEAAARHRAEGVTLDVTGPWAPYNFVAEAPADERRAQRTSGPAA